MESMKKVRLCYMNRKWWQEAVVYQIYPKSFQDSNGDGIGDLRGIMKRMDYLKELGVNTIWLCPINASPMKDGGYDISDYMKIDPSFGTNEDFKELIECAKKAGIRVLMDLVVNHCSDQHEWFKQAVADPNSKYADYFIIEETDGEVPNNLRCYNGYSAWERIGDSNRFYFHCFSKEQPDLNWECEELRHEIIDMMLYWQKMGVAGFRVDAIGNLKKSPKVFEHQPLPTDGTDGMAAIDPYVLLQDGIEDFLGELKREVFDKYDMMTVAEVSVPEDKVKQYTGENGLFSMVFDFTYTDLDVHRINGLEWKRPWTYAELKNRIMTSQEILQKHSWGSPYLENHDQCRSGNKYIPAEDLGYESKTALGALYFFLRGTPFIYQGQELGMENYPFADITEIRDPFAIKRYEQELEQGNDVEADMDYFRQRGRDNSRIPMQWDASVYAGFSEVEPWINVHPDHDQINVEAELEQEPSVLKFYKEMIRLRTKSEYSEILTFGDFRAVETAEDTFFCYDRVLRDRTLRVMVNLCSQPLELPEKLQGGKAILNNLETYSGTSLQPYQAVIL